jgi:hypothetical protein
MAGHLVLLAAFLMQAHPAAPPLGEVILYLHIEDRIHPGDSYDTARDNAARQFHALV